MNIKDCERFKEVYREVFLKKAKNSFKHHFIRYLITNSIFILINIITYKGKIWFIYPLFGWGIGIIMHYLYDVAFAKKRALSIEGQVMEIIVKEEN